MFVCFLPLYMIRVAGNYLLLVPMEYRMIYLVNQWFFKRKIHNRCRFVYLIFVSRWFYICVTWERVFTKPISKCYQRTVDSKWLVGAKSNLSYASCLSLQQIKLQICYTCSTGEYNRVSSEACGGQVHVIKFCGLNRFSESIKHKKSEREKKKIVYF